MRTLLRVVALTTLLVAIESGSAQAGPIVLEPGSVLGTFGWVDDILFGSGSTFDVQNESSFTFESVFVDLFALGATTPFQTLALGDIPSMQPGQSFEDLSSLSVGTDLVQALLRLTLGDTALTATLLASSLTGDSAGFVTTSVDIQAPAPVPEPATLTLLGSSLAAMGWRLRRERRTRLISSSRD
jgi:PEP-CTERM motif